MRLAQQHRQRLHFYVDAEQSDRSRHARGAEIGKMQLGHAAIWPIAVAAAQEMHMLVDQPGDDTHATRIDHIDAA